MFIHFHFFCDDFFALFCTFQMSSCVQTVTHTFHSTCDGGLWFPVFETILCFPPNSQITGNKMTSLNLATIFGPNLLHKQKSSDKEFSVQSSARAEESTAVIAVLQKMIASYQTLFMVSHQPCMCVCVNKSSPYFLPSFFCPLNTHAQSHMN